MSNIKYFICLVTYNCDIFKQKQNKKDLKSFLCVYTYKHNYLDLYVSGQALKA